MSFAPVYTCWSNRNLSQEAVLGASFESRMWSRGEVMVVEFLTP